MLDIAFTLSFKLFLQLPILSVLAYWAYRKKWLTANGAIAAIVMGMFYNKIKDFFLPCYLLVGGSLLSKLNDTNGEKISRNYIQVLTNGGIATLFLFIYNCVPHYYYGNHQFYYLLFAVSFCISITDTFSSEIGKYYKGKTYDITTFKPTEIGLSGGISLKGTIGGIVGAFFASVFFSWLNNFDFSVTIIVAILGAFGMFLDSVLGSLFQAKYQKPNGEITEQQLSESTLIKGYAWCTNNMVNLLSNGIVILLYLAICKFLLL